MVMVVVVLLLLFNDCSAKFSGCCSLVVCSVVVAHGVLVVASLMFGSLGAGWFCWLVFVGSDYLSLLLLLSSWVCMWWIGRFVFSLIRLPALLGQRLCLFASSAFLVFVFHSPLLSSSLWSLSLLSVSLLSLPIL